jgi:hypothetical protein
MIAAGQPRPNDDPKKISHPSARRTTLILGGASLAILVTGGAFTALGGGATSLTFVAVGAGGLFYTRWLARAFRITAIHNRATDVLLRGQLDQAEALLRPLEGTRGKIGQSVQLQLSTLALFRGDMKTAEAHSSRCIDASPNVASSSLVYGIVNTARSTRAFARASMGDAEGARADIEAVRAMKPPHAVPLARAAVAELLLFAKSGDTEGILRALVANERVLELAPPRERAIVRGVERMVAAGGSSIYRKPQSRDAEDAAVGEWMANVAPGLRGFVPKGSAQKSAEPVSVAAPHHAPPLRRAARARCLRVAALWVILVVLFLAIWQLLTPTSVDVAATHTVSTPSDAVVSGVGLPLFVTAIFVAVFSLRIRKASSSMARMRDLENEMLLDPAAALPKVDALTRVLMPATAAHAHFILAQHHERNAIFRDALTAADAGLNRIETSHAMRNAYADILVPGLHVQRALALAAMGRAEEADAASAALSAGFPGYAYLSTAILRVRLISAARGGDFERAWQIAQTRSADMPISHRDELLCAMLKVAHDGAADDDERARISNALRRNDRLRTWIRLVAPGLAETIGCFPDAIDRPQTRARVPSAPDSEEAVSSASHPTTGGAPAPATDDAKNLRVASAPAQIAHTAQTEKIAAAEDPALDGGFVSYVGDEARNERSAK